MLKNLFPVLFAAASLSSAEAVVLAKYDFEAATGSLNSVDNDANSVASPMAISSTISTNSFRSAAGFNYYVRTVATPGTETDAVTGASYFSFTLAPNAGMVLNLTSFDYLMSPTQPGAFPFSGTTFVRSSIDGYTATLDTFGKAAGTTASFTARSVTLTDPQYQNLSSPVTFRIYFYDNDNTPTGTGAGQSNAVVNRIDDVSINGSAIPEPAVTGLLGLAAATGLLRRRK